MMIRSTLSVLVVCGAALFAAGCKSTGKGVHALYVSPAGADGNPGTLAQPFRTLERARDEIRAMKRSAGPPDSGVTVFLRGGTYMMERPFELRPEDSGEEAAPVTYAAYRNEKPVVTGGVVIKDWKPLAGDVRGVRKDVKDRIYVASVPKGWLFHFLYLNGEPQRLSRLYNSDEWHSWPKPVEIGNVADGGQKLVFKPGELDDLEGMDGQIEINLMPVNFWNTISVLRGIDPPRAKADRHSKNPTTFWINSFIEGNYNLMNSIRFVDEPGEWAVNKTEGNVYLFPSTGTIRAEDEVIAPALYRLVDMHGDEGGKRLVRFLRLTGIEFRYTDRMPEDVWPEEWIKRQAELPDAMIRVENAEHITITDCAFLWSGSYAIDLEQHAQNIAVLRNEMGYLGCGGVLLQGYGPGLKDENKNNTIARNTIHHAGVGGYLHSAAVTVYQSGSNDISYNLINHVPYVGIQICGANWDAFNGDPGSNNVDPEDPGGVDSYGKARAQFRTRWEDLPNWHASHFTRETFKPYLHSTANKVHHNLIFDYLEVMSDGAPLYAYSTGMGNLYYNNAMKRRTTALEGQKWMFAIYMDDNVDGAVLTGNVVWAQTDPRVDFHNKGMNMWWGNVHRYPQKPEGFDELLHEILRGGMQRGGWPGGMPVDEDVVTKPDTSH